MAASNSAEMNYTDSRSDISDMESDDEYGDYYDDNDETIHKETDFTKDDPEYFQYELLTIEEAERMLNEHVELLCESIKVSPSLSKVLLDTHGWDIQKIVSSHHKDPKQLLIDAHILPSLPGPPSAHMPHPQSTYSSQVSSSHRGNSHSSSHLSSHPSPHSSSSHTNQHSCLVCFSASHDSKFSQLECGHVFCQDCWQMHFSVQIESGISTGLECMAQGCHILVPERLVLQLVNNPRLRNKYQAFTFKDHIKTHPLLRFCPGPNCSVIVRAKVSQAKRVVCDRCLTTFCFQCGMEYHSPTSCVIIKKWLTKCADDSETANYISAHTKDCPKCHVCIEKNGGCNHMRCSKCKSDFCWMCLGDWKTHGSEYYECSRFKENPNIALESAHAQAREALKKYLFYFERWENHAKSLMLEEQTTEKIKSRIEEQVMKSSGTWIDWQHLLEASSLLRKCRYTLQYTYPFAYFYEDKQRKELFEYQQAQLEVEVEKLSWNVERAEITDRGDLENQMDIAEKRRVTLVKDFLDA